MSVLVNAIMQHALTPGKIIELSYMLGDKWSWTKDNIEESFLSSYWTRKVDWYLRNEWSESDLAILHGSDDWSIYFMEEKILALSNLMRWTHFKNNPVVNCQFKDNARKIAEIIGSPKVLFIPDLGTGSLPKELDQLDKIDTLDNLIQQLTKHSWTDFELE